MRLQDIRAPLSRMVEAGGAVGWRGAQQGSGPAVASLHGLAPSARAPPHQVVTPSLLPFPCPVFSKCKLCKLGYYPNAKGTCSPVKVCLSSCLLVAHLVVDVLTA